MHELALVRRDVQRVLAATVRREEDLGQLWHERVGDRGFVVGDERVARVARDGAAVRRVRLFCLVEEVAEELQCVARGS